MEIPLHQFEQYIDETILKRGLDYFKKGLVNLPEEVTPGKYEAIVEGSEDYSVQLQIKNETIIDYNCSCPYDLGPVCKHIVAVIFYLQQEVLDLQQKQKGGIAGVEIKRKRPISVQVNELLGKVSHKELEEFIRKNAERNPTFRNIFLTAFAHLSKTESKDFYVEQVKSILRTATGGDDFVDLDASRLIGNAVRDLLALAQTHFENKNYNSAVLICCAVMEEMTDAIGYADDSHGNIGRNIDEAYELLNQIASTPLTDELRKYLFEYCLTSYRKNIFAGWDWHLGILEIAAQLIKSDMEAKEIIALLDKVSKNEYGAERAGEIKLQIIRNRSGEGEAEKFMEQNSSNPILRAELIQKSINKKDFEKAIALAEEGISYDAKNSQGLVMEWYDWLLKIAIMMKESEKIIDYARVLFLDSMQEKMPYYQLMKEQVKQANWTKFVEQLIKDLEKKNGWNTYHQIAAIYISEQWWDRLLGLIQTNNCSLDNIEQYEKYLAKGFPQEIIALYEKGVTEYLKNHKGRDHYETACRYMRRMLKLGAKEKVNNMISQFKTQYPQRRALMEELARI